MLPHISSDIHRLPSTRVVENDSKSNKISSIWQKFQRNSTQDIMAHTSRTFQSKHVYYKNEESSRWFFYWYIMFFRNHPNLQCYIFTYALHNNQSKSQIDKVNNHWLKREKPKSDKPRWKARNNPRKGPTKNTPFEILQ